MFQFFDTPSSLVRIFTQPPLFELPNFVRFSPSSADVINGIPLKSMIESSHMQDAILMAAKMRRLFQKV